MSKMQPIAGAERLQVLDALRGFALFGILLVNLVSFLDYNTYSSEETAGLPAPDRAVLFSVDWFVEGKFYGIFSILFGVGPEMLERATRFDTLSVSIIISI